jgi:excisionase family DNA binding protein
MKLKPVPANTLAAIAALLGPYVEQELAPHDILAAIRGHDGRAAVDPAARRVLSLSEAGNALGVTKWTVRRMAMDGRIESLKIGSLWKIPLSAIDTFVCVQAGTRASIGREG